MNCRGDYIETQNHSDMLRKETGEGWSDYFITRSRVV